MLLKLCLLVLEYSQGKLSDSCCDNPQYSQYCIFYSPPFITLNLVFPFSQQRPFRNQTIPTNVSTLLQPIPMYHIRKRCFENRHSMPLLFCIYVRLCFLSFP